MVEAFLYNLAFGILGILTFRASFDAEKIGRENCPVHTNLNPPLSFGVFVWWMSMKRLLEVFRITEQSEL